MQMALHPWPGPENMDTMASLCSCVAFIGTNRWTDPLPL